MFKKLKLLSLIFTLIISPVHGQLYDLFPLSVGKKFDYEYASYDTTRWMGSLDHIQIDSGEVVVTVNDSSFIGDDLVEWSISEIINIRRYYKNSEDPYMYGYIDSTYFICDTISLELYESLIDRHKIQCYAKSLKDSICLSNNNSIRIWEFNDYDNIYRYNSNTEDSNIRNYGGMFGLNRESLFFKDKVGLYKRSYYFYQETHHSGPISFNARLKDVFVDVKCDKLLHKGNDCNIVKNYPNPFNTSTIIEFDLLSQSNVEFYVFNINGQVVHQESFGIMQRGKNHILYNRQELSSGIYNYVIIINNNKKLVNKFVLLK